MRKVQIFFNSEEGADWWCEDNGNFMAVADTPTQLLQLIQDWLDSEQVEDVRVDIPDHLFAYQFDPGPSSGGTRSGLVAE